MTDCILVATEPITVAVCAYVGPARGAGVAFDQVLSWADVYHVGQWGPLVGVYFDSVDPDTALEAEAWLQVPKGTRLPESDDDRIVLRIVEAEQVASLTHRGFPDGVGEALTTLLAWADDQGLERSSTSHRQVYHHAPEGRPGEWVVEVQVPVQVPMLGPEAPHGDG